MSEENIWEAVRLIARLEWLLSSDQKRRLGAKVEAVEGLFVDELNPSMTHNYVDSNGHLYGWAGIKEDNEYIHIVYREPQYYSNGRAWYQYIRIDKRKGSIEKVVEAIKRVAKKWKEEKPD